LRLEDKQRERQTDAFEEGREGGKVCVRTDKPNQADLLIHLIVVKSNGRRIDPLPYMSRHPFENASSYRTHPIPTGEQSSFFSLLS